MFNLHLKDKLTIWFLLILFLFSFMLPFYFHTYLFLNDYFVKYLIILLSFTLCISYFSFIQFSCTFFGLMLIILLSFSMYLMFMLNNSIYMYIVFELSLLPIVLLIYFFGYQPERLYAIIYMMLYTMVASLPFMMYLFYKYYNFYYLVWSNLNFILDSGMFLIMGLAFLVKLPMFMFHFWLPKAHVEAPVVGSMMLAAVMLKMGSYGLYRLSMSMVNIFKWELISLSLIGSIIISFICFYSSDLKNIIALSSVSHMGMMLVSMLLFNYMSIYMLIMISVSHGFTSMILFYWVGVIYNWNKSRSLILYKNLSYLYKFFSLIIMVSLILNFGSPPSINFLGEFGMIINLMNFSYMFSIFLIIYMLVVTLFCLNLLLNIIFMTNFNNSNYFMSKFLMMPMMVNIISILLYFNMFKI